MEFPTCTPGISVNPIPVIYSSGNACTLDAVCPRPATSLQTGSRLRVEGVRVQGLGSLGFQSLGLGF